MALFNSKEIADLQAQVSTLQGELATAQTAHAAALADIQANLEAAQAIAAKVPDLEAKVTAETARADKAAADLAAANAEAEKKIEAEVVNRLASAGVDPIKRDPQAKTEDPAPTAGLTGIAKSRAALAAKKPAK